MSAAVPEIPSWGFVTASSNEAYIISGGCCGGGEPTVVCGGKSWVWPWCQKVQWISMNSWGDQQIVTKGVYTRHGVPVDVVATAVMQVRTENDEIPVPYVHRDPRPGPPHPTALMLLLDAGPEMNLSRGSTRKLLIDLATQTLEGHQRGFLGSVTMEQLFRDETRDDADARSPKDLIRDEVLRHAEPDLLNMGIKLISYTIKEIDDENDYLKNIGVARTATVHAQSRIGSELHKKNELINQEVNDAMVAKQEYSNKIKEAESTAKRRERAAENKIAESEAKAKEEFADDLQRAKTQQQIVSANLQRQLIEKVKDVASAEQEIIRQSRVLEASVSRPSASRARAIMEEARGQSTLTVMQARGESESLKLSVHIPYPTSRVVQLKQLAEGEASAIESKGIANAEVIREKAISYNQYKGSALVDIVLNDLPKVAAEIAAPLARINKASMISRGGGSVGHSRLADEVAEIMNMIPAALSDMTGIDIARSIENAAASDDVESAA